VISHILSGILRYLYTYYT